MRRGFRTTLKMGLVAIALAAAQMPANAALVWTWDYDGPGVSASGSFTTGDTADASGYVTITSISGQRNGIAITGLQAAGTPIPGNAPFAVDNLVRETSPFLTVEGFGFSLADGTFANPFFASFLATPGHLEFFSAPPFGSAGPEDSEVAINFRAAVVRTAVPEPAGLGLIAAALAGMTLLRRRTEKLDPDNYFSTGGRKPLQV